MRNRGIQPAHSSLAYYLTIPQWRCKRGHWNDVSSVSRRCYFCEERPKLCLRCSGDGEFEIDPDHTVQCEACAGWGIQWDWPDDSTPPIREERAADDIVF